MVKGETKTMKSISAPSVRHLHRKEDVFTAKGRPGAHSQSSSVPLSFFLRSVVMLTQNLKESKKILSEGKVKINGTVRKNSDFQIGLFDVVEIAAIKKKFRVLFDLKGRLEAKEIDFNVKNFKLSKIVKKRAAKGGKMFVTTNDGFTIESGKEKLKVGDSVKLSLPELKIESVYVLGNGSTAFVTGGRHVGKVTKIDSITEGSLQRKKLVALETGEGKFLTAAENVFVVGKDKSEIEALHK